jgi:hypothetical protein
MFKHEMQKILIALIFFFIYNLGYSQTSIKDSTILIPLLKVTYSGLIPDLDYNKRFGAHSVVGLELELKNDKNWLFGVNYGFIFGNKIKEEGIFRHISSSEGFVISEIGQATPLRFFQRGHHINVRFGKVFNFWSPNPNSGFFATVSPGFLQHRIKIDDVANSSPQINDEYEKGYDRMSNGFAISETFGYMYLSNNRLVNFFVAVEFTQAFTKNRRGYNFDTMDFDTANRKDFTHGIRLGWILPLYKKMPNNFYYY